MTVAVRVPEQPVVAPRVAGREPATGGAAVMSMLRRGWWLGLAVLVLVVASAAFFTSRQEPVYRSTTMVVVMPSAEVTEPSELMRALDTLERRTVLATFARIPMAPETIDAIAERLQRDSTELLGVRIAAGVVPNTNIIRVDVDGPTATLLPDVANAAAQHMREEAASIYRIFGMREVAAASVPGRPVHPDPRQNLLVAVILGLFAAGLAIFVLDRTLSLRRFS